MEQPTKFYLEHYGLGRHRYIRKAIKCENDCDKPFWYEGSHLGRRKEKSRTTCEHIHANNNRDRFEYCLDCEEWGDRVQ